MNLIMFDEDRNVIAEAMKIRLNPENLRDYC